MIKNRLVFFEKAIYFVMVLLYVFATIAGWFGIDADSVKISFNPLAVKQEITGWGTSAAWWAQMIDSAETADEYAKLLYSEEGLGLNVYRYNVGGGERDNPNNRVWWHDSRTTESFLKADVYESTGKLEYDWSKDANAQQMLFKSLEYGCVDTVVLFANSPHYLMTASGSAAGSYEVDTNNLKEECYEDFADYMLDIAEYFISKNVPVKYISPINEPEWSWGGEWVGQEGCHYNFDSVLKVAKIFAQKIKERGLDVKLSLLESGQVSLEDKHYALDGIDAIYADEDIRSVLGTYAYHSYWNDDNLLLKYAFGKYIDTAYPKVELEMSEWCELPCSHEFDDIEAGILMARTISEDVSITGVNSWSSWVAVNEGGVKADSMIAVDGDYDEYSIGKRYYALAHFSKFVPAGSKRLATKISVADITAEKSEWPHWINNEAHQGYVITNDLYVSQFVTPDGDYVAVIVNEADEGKTLKFDNFWRSMSVYTTDAEKNLELTKELGVGSFKNVEIGANSITTVVFD